MFAVVVAHYFVYLANWSVFFFFPLNEIVITKPKKFSITLLIFLRNSEVYQIHLFLHGFYSCQVEIICCSHFLSGGNLRDKEMSIVHLEVVSQFSVPEVTSLSHLHL